MVGLVLGYIGRDTAAQIIHRVHQVWVERPSPRSVSEEVRATLSVKSLYARSENLNPEIDLFLLNLI